ncbi:hypothetical protein FA13DRAFT_1824593 [Coprinellus micaceus]|uniref:LysM domain-containing protein n=1 Tax=Coprinellus micaceus TaxID=71717 RepID=A0A4Y7RC78_COPMI|nr:hypothetical protein FA13DRAFT_1824593 [Coprinellus micaceus]
MNPKELDLTFNPFDDDGSTDEATPQNQLYFGSAFLPNATTPTTRRRSSFGSSNGSSSAIRKRHTRSRTEFNLDIADQELSGHPLKSAALRSAAFQDFDITRPHLSRIVQKPEESGNRSPPVKEEEKEVIIHEITSKDSLAGVSLRYGIPLPELRRANQLWASDSIHLRKVLYIPIDRAKRAHEYIVAGLQRSAPPSPTTLDEVYLPQSFGTRSPTSSHPSPAGSSSEVSNPRIQKMPASQLSFFPPSTNPSRVQTPAATPSPVKTEFNTQRAPYLKPNAGTRTGSSPANSLSSLLNTFPIAASTRDEIVSRLSFDSVSSSYSDHPGSRSRGGSDEETGHEMDDVNKRIGSTHIEDSDLVSLSMQTPRPQIFNEIPLLSTSWSKDTSSLLMPTQARPLLSTSPPSSYVPQQPYNPYVRTQQLEPSPVMQIPSKGGRAVGRTQSLGRASSKDFAKLSLYPPTIGEPRGKPVKNSGSNAGTGE